MPKIPSRPALDLSGKLSVALPSLPPDYLARTDEPHILIGHEEFHVHGLLILSATPEAPR